jgi:hypothetical protein
VLVEQFHQLGKVCQGPGEPVDLVHHDGVDLAGSNVGQQDLQAGSIERGTGETPSS